MPRIFREKLFIEGVKGKISTIMGTFRRIFRTRSVQMKFLVSLALRNATRPKYRSFLLVLGMIFTTALETGIVVSIDTLYDDFISDHKNQNDTDITIHPTKWHNLTNLKTLARDIQKTSGVAQASPVYYITLDQFMQGRLKTKIILYGIDSQTHPDFNNLNVIDGKKIVSANTIMISKRVQDITGKKVDEKILLSSIDPRLNTIDVTIGGVMSNEPYFANKIGFLFLLVDIETLVTVIPDDQKANLLTCEIDVSVNNYVNIKKTSENIKDKVGLEYYVFLEKDISEIQATGIRAYQSAMNLVIIASLFVEFLFITNILIIAIKDRQREFGILRAVGCGSRQLILLIGMEILLYSIIGCTFGVFVGISFSTLLIGLMGEFYPSLEFQLISIHPSSIITTFLSGIIVSLIAGLYPIFLAIKMPVIQNIHFKRRTLRSSDIFTNWRYTVAIGVLLIFTGYSLQFFIGPSHFLDFSLLSTHFFIVILIFLGTVLLEIGLLVFLPRISNKILFWFGIITRTIAMRNLAREFQKSLFTIMTSTMALTFIIVVGLTSAAITAAVPDYFQSQWKGIELVAEVRDTTLQSIDLTQELDNRSDIKRSSFIQETRTDIGGINGYIFGVDPLKYAYFSEHVLSAINEQPSYEILNSSIENRRGNATNGLVSHLLYQKFNPQIPLGSNVLVKLADNSMVNITLGAVIKGNVFLGGGEYLYITSERYQDFFNSSLAKWFVCDVEGDIAATQVSLEVTYYQFKEVIGITFFKNALERSLIFQTVLFHVIFLESFILSAIAQFVCILVSTLRTEREMGIMRGMGLHKRQVFSIFMAESTALAFSALIFGLIDGLIGSILLTWYISLSIPVEIRFPFDRIVLWVIISFAITLTSTLPPSYRSSQNNLVATISGRPMAKVYVEKREESVSFDEHPYYTFWSAYPVPNNVPNSISFWGFLKYNKTKIQITFLILLIIMTANYILDQSLIMRGLVLSDYIWRNLFLQLFVKTTDDLIISPPTEIFLYINPLFLFLGLAAIGPIVSYLAYGTLPRNQMKGFFKSFISAGIAGILVCFVLFTIHMIVIIFLLGFTTVMIPGYIIDLPLQFFIIIIGLGILIVIFELLIFQRIWAFLIFQGVNFDLSLLQKLTWTRNNGSKGQIGFLFLNSVHILIQSILYISSQAYRELSPNIGLAFPLDPPAFLIFASFEVCFFLLLIIYQLFQFQKQKFFSKPPSINSEGLDKEITQLLPTSQKEDTPPQEHSKNVPIKKEHSLICFEE